ncbi:acylphosphatase-2-like [Branchiostoma floridae]|uniref:Acylphosphatase n=1 Tax=Branchiostoma floridae TaxID=7739 RepID=A0A9J7LN66_BRAFL|nr:acylphosphatase-2-like [Branchiostoma floridae]
MRYKYVGGLSTLLLCLLMGLTASKDQPPEEQQCVAMPNLVSVEYEIHGNVQGVFFRAYTEEQASRLGLVGWVRNTRRGTVDGVVQGRREQVKQMKQWLEFTGSPMSRIERATFRNEKDISKLDFDRFKITY